MNQDQIAAIFRQGELARRAERRQQLLALLKNEAALLTENLNEKDKIAHETAIQAVRRQEHEYWKASRPGYWNRLWLALLGR